MAAAIGGLDDIRSVEDGCNSHATAAATPAAPAGRAAAAAAASAPTSSRSRLFETVSSSTPRFFQRARQKAGTASILHKRHSTSSTVHSRAATAAAASGDRKMPLGGSEVNLGRRGSEKQYSNLFPCPLVKTLDLDSPEGSMSSLGLVSCAPFASSTGYALAAAASGGKQRPLRRSYQQPQRARSVQSPTAAAEEPAAQASFSTSGSCGGNRLCVNYGGGGLGGSVSPMSAVPWPRRQSSLPAYTFSGGGIGGGGGSSCGGCGGGGGSGCLSRPPSVSPAASGSRSPRAPHLKQAKSMHAQTHKLKRQVTICEDSVSIPDSVLFSRQCSRSESLRAVSAAASPQPPQPPPPRSLTPSPILRPPSSRSRHTPQLPQQPQQQQQPQPQPPPPATRLAPVLPRQESSFTVEEINR